MTAFALPLSLMLLCVLAELAWRRWQRGEAIPWHDTVFNLGSGHILMWYFRAFEIAAFALVLRHANLHWIDRWPTAAQWIFGFIAWDFCFYWMHRLHHSIPLLWAVHVVHHEGEHYNLSLGIRNSWYSSLTNLPFVIGLAVLGLPLEIFVVVSSIHYAVQFYNHNDLVRTSGLLERFMVTPAHHRVHHANHPDCFDCNFGGTFLWWDKIFGSFRQAPAGVELRYGVPHPCRSRNPLIASNAPFVRHWKKSTSRASTTGPLRLSANAIGIGGLLLFAAVIHLIQHDGSWPAQQQALLAALIFLGTIALGALCDGRRWGAWAWLLIGLALPIAGWHRSVPLDGWALAIHGLLCLHGLSVATRLRATA